MNFIKKEMKKGKSLEKITKDLVQKHIKGKRKGMLYNYNYEHSFYVYDTLVKDGYDRDMCIAGLLHDIIEDGGLTASQLLELGYNKRTVDLIVACSHDNTIKDSFKKRKKMVDKIKKTKNEDALIIKIADFSHNLRTSHLLKKDRYYNFLYKKGQYLMDLIYKHLDSTEWDVSPLKDIFFDRWNTEKEFYF